MSSINERYRKLTNRSDFIEKVTSNVDAYNAWRRIESARGVGDASRHISELERMIAPSAANRVNTVNEFRKRVVERAKRNSARPSSGASGVAMALQDRPVDELLVKYGPRNRRAMYAHYALVSFMSAAALVCVSAAIGSAMGTNVFGAIVGIASAALNSYWAVKYWRKTSKHRRVNMLVMRVERFRRVSRGDEEKLAELDDAATRIVRDKLSIAEAMLDAMRNAEKNGVKSKLSVKVASGAVHGHNEENGKPSGPKRAGRGRGTSRA